MTLTYEKYPRIMIMAPRIALWYIPTPLEILWSLFAKNNTVSDTL